MRALETTALVGLALMLLGCPRDQDTPPQIDTSNGDADATNTDPSTLDTMDPTSDGSGDLDTTAASSDSGTTGNECLGADGCYACNPEDSVQLLNHCTDADCEPFANTQKRLPRLEADGSLPPIP
ncbi:MAG: hypothetical protein IAG13_27845 [Deltaproteobacteria bacterium]|nr:hypothetical protein [Nannocystaceae bacterium]